MNYLKFENEDLTNIEKFFVNIGYIKYFYFVGMKGY